MYVGVSDLKHKVKGSKGTLLGSPHLACVLYSMRNPFLFVCLFVFLDGFVVYLVVNVMRCTLATSPVDYASHVTFEEGFLL